MTGVIYVSKAISKGETRPDDPVGQGTGEKVNRTSNASFFALHR